MVAHRSPVVTNDNHNFITTHQHLTQTCIGNTSVAGCNKWQLHITHQTFNTNIHPSPVAANDNHNYITTHQHLTQTCIGHTSVAGCNKWQSQLHITHQTFNTNMHWLPVTTNDNYITTHQTFETNMALALTWQSVNHLNILLFIVTISPFSSP